MSYIIVGKSPFIHEIKDWSFTEKHTVICINEVNPPCKVSYRVANDSNSHYKIAVKKFHDSIGGGIYHRKNYKTFKKNNPDLDLPITMLYDWSPDWNTSLIVPELYCRHTSIMAALNFIIKENLHKRTLPNVYLIGVDFTWGNRGEWRIGEMCGAVGRVLEYMNLYRCNPQEETPLSWLEYKDVKDL